MRKTSAWLFVGAYVLLVIYASLFPFVGWRYQGGQSWGFLWAGPPQFWTAFDVLSNLFGYAPLGFLLVIAQIRGGQPLRPVRRAVTWAALLSLGMEAIQVFLPARVPSNADITLNALGAWTGAFVAWRLHQTGVVAAWVRRREAWFLPDARVELVLLMLWPCALLFPTPIPLGLGQIWGRLAFGDESLDAAGHAEGLAQAAAMSPWGEMLTVALGSAVPVLLAYAVMPVQWRRLQWALGLLGAGMLATTMSVGASLGVTQALQWLEHRPVQLGLLLGVGAAGLSRRLPARHIVVMATVLLLVYLLLLNIAGGGAYFQQTLQSWQQGRFSRFHGLLEWLGWAWPYAVLLALLHRLWQTRPSKIDP